MLLLYIKQVFNRKRFLHGLKRNTHTRNRAGQTPVRYAMKSRDRHGMS